jgi:hypothetical protein
MNVDIKSVQFIKVRQKDIKEKLVDFELQIQYLEEHKPENESGYVKIDNLHRTVQTLKDELNLYSAILLTMTNK